MIDCNTFAKCAVVSVKGKVCTAVDNTTPVSGAKITAAGDNDLSAITDTEGCFVLEGALANKAYPILTIEADGYKTSQLGRNTILRLPGSGVYEMPAINMTPVTAAPFSDGNGLRRQSRNLVGGSSGRHSLSKCSDDIAGQFGGPQTLSIAHRYSPEDLESLGVDDSSATQGHTLHADVLFPILSGYLARSRRQRVSGISGENQCLQFQAVERVHTFQAL